MKFKLGQKIIDKLRNKKQNENKMLLENVRTFKLCWRPEMGN